MSYLSNIKGTIFKLGTSFHTQFLEREPTQLAELSRIKKDNAKQID